MVNEIIVIHIPCNTYGSSQDTTIDMIVIIKTNKKVFSTVQGLFSFYFAWGQIIKLYFIHLRIFKSVKTNANGIIIVMVFIVASMYIVRIVFPLFVNTIVSDVAFNFYFVFSQRDGTAKIAIMITKSNNHGVLLAPSTIGAIYAAGLKDQIVKFSKMVYIRGLTTIFLMMLSILQHIFEICLLFFEVMFIVRIALIGYFFCLSEKHNQNIKQSNRLLMCKDQFIFNCIRMLKLYLQHLQIFNDAMCITYDISFMCDIMNVIILVRHTFVNDLLFHFMVFIFISMDIAARTTRIGFSVTTIAARRIIHATVASIIEAPHKNIPKSKNLLHLDSIVDLYDQRGNANINYNGQGDIKFKCNIAVSDMR